MVNDMDRRAVLLLNGLAALGAAAMTVAELGGSDVPNLLTREDHPLEWSGALAFLLAGGLFAVTARRLRRRNLLVVGLALMLVLIGFEEISWGQRIFGFATPEGLNDANVQDEFNLHNIEGVHGSIRALGLLVLAGICYVLPAADRLSPSAHRLLRQIRMPIFPMSGMGLITVALMLMVLPRLLLGEARNPLDELGEVLIGVAFAVFGVEALVAATAEGTLAALAHPPAQDEDEDVVADR